MKSLRRIAVVGERRRHRRTRQSHWINAAAAIATTSSSSSTSNSRRRLRCRCRGFVLVQMILAAIQIAVGGTMSAAEAFSSRMAATTTTTTTSRLPLAVAVRNGQRRQQKQQQQKQHILGASSPTTATTTTRLNLFFNKRDEDGNLKQKQKNRRGRLTSEALDELRSASGISFPKEVQLKDKDSTTEPSLFLRYMTTDDLKALVPMCINEFGSESQQQQQQNKNNEKGGSSTGIMRIPQWLQYDPKHIPDLWEGFSFELLISLTLRLKLMQGGNNSQSNNNDIDSNINSKSKSYIDSSLNDPVMLVLCERRQGNNHHQQQQQRSSSPSHHQDMNKDNIERVVGMVELSLQPPDANRNPPALPLPRWVKSTLARQTLDGSLQGWVTNLLIDSTKRGLGYSKILMAATEGIAKHQWGCHSIYLHADADIQSGKIPQSLYESLGYNLVTGSTTAIRKGILSIGNKKVAKSMEEEFAWAGAVGQEMERFTAIRMVDGVALLCYSKRL